MNLWIRYVVGFFAFVLILSALIFVLGPREYRDAYRSGASPVGQLPSNADLETNGPATSDTSSATTQPPPADR